MKKDLLLGRTIVNVFYSNGVPAAIQLNPDRPDQTGAVVRLQGPAVGKS